MDVIRSFAGMRRGASSVYSARGFSAPAFPRLVATVSVFALTLLSGFAATDARATTTAVGALAGAGGVSASGAATYTIPINVPPGTHGMQPSLALVYDSQGGDGYAGYGWTLSGFSTIARCAQTVADDGAAAPIQYAGTDDYCLDGQRLIVTSGNPGSGTAHYETQIKDFAQITSFSGSSTFGGPGYFTVATKDGRVYEYGNTSDSQIVAEGTAKIRAWALDKVTDGSGDYMEYAYGSSTTAGRQFYPVSIDYTRNGSTAADHTIQFDYSARPSTSIITRYVDGSIITNSKLLSDIKIFYSTNTTPTFTYNLSYDQDSVSGRSRLLSVNECGNDGSCLPATTITWKDAQAGWASAQSTSVTLDDGTLANAAHLMDVDGDGLDDLVYPDDSTGDWMVMFGVAAGGFGSPVDTGDFYATTTYMYSLVMDYDGDGKADLIQPISTGGWQVLTSTGARTSGAGGIFTRPSNNIPDLSGNNSVTGLPIYEGEVWTADVTGDGVSDVLDANGAHVQRNINSGPPFPQTFTSGNVYADSGLTKKTNIVFQDAGTDFDGSGRIGGLVLKTSGSPATYTWIALTLSGSSLVSLGTVSGDGSTVGATPFDSNGDGVTDLLTPSASGHWQVSISTGSTSSGFVSPLTSTATVNTSLDSFAADYYDNGTQVALVYDNSASAWKVLDTNFSSGSFTLSTTAVSTPPFIGSGGGSYWPGSLRIGHVQAAGLDDLVFSVKTALSQVWTFYYSLHNINSGTNPAPDRVTQVTDGFGNYCQFKYSSLAGASSSLYTPGSGDDYPTQHIQPAMQVISQYTESDGIGGSYNFTYAYTDAEADATGRGFMGFASRTITDSRSGDEETITYDQAFPYTGMVTQDVLKDSSGHRIWEIDNTGADQITSGTGHSTRYFPFFDSSVRHDYDNVGGSNYEVRTTTTTLSSSSFDSYGNQVAGSTTIVDNVTSGSPTFTTTTAASYATPGSGYCVGAPSSVTVTNAVPADALGATFPNNTSRNVAISQDTANCRPDSQVVSSPVSGTPTVTTAYNSYDSWGNATQTEVSGTGVDRLTDYDFSGGGNSEFPTSVTAHPTGALSLTSSATWYYDYGLMHTSTDPNGHQTTLAYDAYGRLIQATNPDGSYTTRTYTLCSDSPGSCVSTGIYLVTESHTASGLGTVVTGYTVYDSRGRVLKQTHTLLGGVGSRVSMAYDQMGNVVTKSQPYILSADRANTTYTYDLSRNRLTEIDAPPAENDTCSTNCDVTTLSYDGFTATASRVVSNHATSSGTQATSRTMDALGRVSSVEDANGSITTYEYDAFGDLVATQAPAGQDSVAHVTLMSYDGLGNKTGMVDPNMGTWSYAVDPLGEITCQTDADGQSIGMAYDDIGRLTSKLETATGGCAGTQVASSTWTYDTATNGLGMLAEVLDTTSGSSGYARDYAYDSLSRPSDVTTTIGTTPYTVSTTYDNFGRVSTVTYPESVTPATPGSPPTVSAGADVTINLGDTATLDGSGSGPITSTLQFQWSQTGGPVTLPLGSFDQAAEQPTVTPTVVGTYTFQLQVIDSGTSLSSADSVTLTVNPLPPGSAPTVSPNPSTNGNVTVSWSAGTGASTYVLSRSTTAGGNYTTIYSGITGTSKADTGLSNGTYYYKVASTANGVTGDASSHSSVLNVTLPPGAPTGMTVPSFSAPSTNYTASWTAPGSGTVTTYELLEDNNSGFTSPTTYTITAPTHTKTRSEASVGTYYYKVRACNGTACSGYSGVDHVVVEAVPLAPTMALPDPSTISSGDNSLLSWSKHAGDTVTFYNQRVSFTSTFTGSGTNIGNVTSQTVHPTVTKYWDVQACNDVGCGPWSNTESVTVDFGGGLVMPQKGDPMDAPQMLATTLSMPGEPGTEVPGIVDPMADVPMASLERVPSPVLAAAPASAFAALDAMRQARQALVAGQPMQASESALQAKVAGLAQRVPQNLAFDRHALPVAGQAAYAPPVYAAYAGARHETVGGSPFRFTVQYAYDPSSGGLEAVADADTGFIYWRAATDSGSAPVDAFGHLLGYTDGNNVSTISTYDSVTGALDGISSGIGSSESVQQLVYAWDNFGNLKQRCDANQGLTETFGYDVLNRITASTVSTGASACVGGTTSGNPAITMAYDAVGNITGRTNTGITVGMGTLNDTYAYGDSSHPYAVTGVTSISGSYVYDANGNMTSGNGRTITWNVDNLPVSITSSSTVNGNDTVTGSSAFSYSPDLQRYHQVATDSNGTTTTDYVGSLFEVVTNSSDTEFRHSILAAGGVVAVHTLYLSDGHGRTSYIHSDHLGSSDAITDDTGAVAQVMSFDAFGLRRDPTNWKYDLTGTQVGYLKDTTDRGYTNQEQLDNVGLVHMNGRVYDPSIGRFISADPTIPNPLYSQAFDRYAYVFNNPLAMLDPTGFGPRNSAPMTGSHIPGVDTGATCAGNCGLASNDPAVLKHQDSGGGSGGGGTLTCEEGGICRLGPTTSGSSSGVTSGGLVPQHGYGNENYGSTAYLGKIEVTASYYNAELFETQLALQDLQAPDAADSDVDQLFARANEIAVRGKHQRTVDAAASDLNAMLAGSASDEYWRNFQQESQHSGLADQSLIVNSSVDLSEGADETALKIAGDLADYGAGNASSAGAFTTFMRLGIAVEATELIILAPKAFGLGVDIANSVKAFFDFGHH